MRTSATAALTAALGALALVLMPPAAAAPRYAVIALSHADHTVYELDPDSGAILHHVVVPGEPGAAAIAPDGGTIYVTMPTRGSIQAIDARTFSLAGRIDSRYFTPRRATASGLGSLDLNSAGTKLYVGVGQPSAASLVEVDLKSRLTRKFDLGLKGGQAFQIQPGTDWLYYPFREADRVVVFDTTLGRRTATFPVKGGPGSVGFAPNGDVWFHGDRDGTVTIVSSMTNRIQRVLRTGGRGAGRIAVSPDGHYAASTRAGSQEVVLIDARTKRVLGSVRTGKGPAFPLFSPDGARLFVMTSGDGAIVVIDVTARKVTARWKVGTDPFGGGLRYLARRRPPAA